MTDVLDATPVALPVLTADETAALQAYERRIEKGWRAFERVAIEAITAIRDQRLYKARHRNFDNWCEEFLGMSRSAVDRRIGEGTARQPQSIEPAPERIKQRQPQGGLRVADPIPATSTENGRPARRTTGDQEPAHLDPEPQSPSEPPGLLPPPPRKRKREDERTIKRADARNALNRILTAIDGGDHALMYEVATTAERSRIANFAVTFGRKPKADDGEVVEPEKCWHPANRRLGDQCGACGTKVGKR